MELSYSLHLGSDKNKKSYARRSSKTNKSGTTSYANNAIQNAKTLSKVAHHNYGKYEDKERDIKVLVGSSSLEKDVMRIYKEEFEDAKEKYNDKQTREDRKIKDYFKKISNDSKSDLACEIIIELGDKAFWDLKDDEYKRKMTPVYKKQVEDLKMLVPEFKVASAIIHYDETSPHMHIVGVPVKENCKTGMEKQVGKGAVFTKESLRNLQDKMRVLCIESFNMEYNEQKKLKTKLKGRNIDYDISEMGNYQKKIKEADKQREKIEKLDKKALDLDRKTKDVRETLINLKTTLTSKDKYVLTETNKNTILTFLEDVSNTNNDYKKLKELSVDLRGLDEDIKKDKERVKQLKQNNKALNLRVDILNDKIKDKNRKIENLEYENSRLRSIVAFLENKFKKLKEFIRNKIFDRDEDVAYRYDKVMVEMYEDKVLSEKDVDEICEERDYKHSKDDDFDLSL